MHNNASMGTNKRPRSSSSDNGSSNDNENQNNLKDYSRHTIMDNKLVELYLEPMNNEQIHTLLVDMCSNIPEAADFLRNRTEKSDIHRKVFIRGLDYQSTASDVRPIFAEHGEIDDCVLVMDPVTSRSKGFGFVTYALASSAYECIQNSPKTIKGRQCFASIAAVKSKGNEASSSSSASSSRANDYHSSSSSNPYSVGSSMNNNKKMHNFDPDSVEARQVFLRGVGYETTVDKIRQAFSVFGDIDEATLSAVDKITGKHKGFAFVTFRSSNSTQKAIDKSELIVDGRTVKIHLAAERKLAAGGSSSYGSGSGYGSSTYGTGTTGYGSGTYGTSSAPYGSSTYGSNAAGYGSGAYGSSSGTYGSSASGYGGSYGNQYQAQAAPIGSMYGNPSSTGVAAGSYYGASATSSAVASSINPSQAYSPYTAQSNGSSAAGSYYTR